MLCSECKKNEAAIFVNEVSKDGKLNQIGYCYDCAKRKGIHGAVSNGNFNLSEADLNNMTNQLNGMLKDLSEKLSSDEINPEDIDISASFSPANLDDADGENMPNGAMGFAIPIGSFFSGMFNGNGKNTDNNSNMSGNERKAVKTETKQQTNKKLKTLNTYGTNLTSKAKNGQIDSVIGRDKEIARIIQILNRRTKNNPCLIGEPGVGKTAIAQGLALRIASENVPAKLLSKEVYLLDMTAVVAGTQFRGQFEARMKNIIEECKQAGNIILVIDEIHNIIGAGDSDHAMNAANILKPSLADGTIQLIGTTTLNEYRKYIEKDTALERRFQPVMIEEPSISDAIEMLKGIKHYYENYHKVTISNDVIDKLVHLSEKYIHDRFLPDKAIDVLDEACSRINLDNKDLYNLEILRNKLADVQLKKEEAASADSTDDYKKAAELKMQECNLTDQINAIEEKMVPKELTVEDVAKVIENWTKIPVQKITEEETKKLISLEDNLHKRVIGQNDAVAAVSRAIRRNRAGLKSTKRPPSFIFVGPTGVGKTELAKALCYEVFGNEDSIIRIDMSEYMESNSTAKLIGAPPGYVGYDEAGQLTDKVKRHPYSIVLLDEIEKAHSDVFNILLQVLDDGRLTDSQGNTVSFENTIIIMTSNAGSSQNQNSIGFGKTTESKKAKITDSLRETFRPEFLNRVDEIVVFDSLQPNELTQIIDLMLKDTQNVLNDRNINMYVSSEAKSYLLQKGTDTKYGARPLRRAVQRYIEDELSDMILKGELKNGQKVFVDLKDNALSFEVKNK